MRLQAPYKTASEKICTSLTPKLELTRFLAKVPGDLHRSPATEDPSYGSTYYLQTGLTTSTSPLSSIFRQQETSTPGPPLQQQVGRKINHQRYDEEVCYQVKPALYSVLLSKK